MAKNKRNKKGWFGKFFSKDEKKAFRSGLRGERWKSEYKNNPKVEKSWRKGFNTALSDDYIVAKRFTDHMNRKFGSFDENGKLVCDKHGRALGANNKPLPSAYSNYKNMSKDPLFRKDLYDDYGHDLIYDSKVRKF